MATTTTESGLQCWPEPWLPQYYCAEYADGGAMTVGILTPASHGSKAISINVTSRRRERDDLADEAIANEFVGIISGWNVTTATYIADA